MVTTGQSDNPISRRCWLLCKALETLPLAEGLELARSAEEFLIADQVSNPEADQTSNKDDDVVAALPVVARLGAADHRLPNQTAETWDPALSRREVEILQCLPHGCSNKDIAHQLGLAEATVKVHLKAILRKLKVANRTQAAIWVVTRGDANPASTIGPDQIANTVARPTTTA